MATRDPWAVQNPGPTGIMDVAETRLAIAALMRGNARETARSGFRPASSASTSAGAVTASGTPDKFVHIAQGQLFLTTVRGAHDGTYIGTNDAQVDMDLLTGHPADPTNPRNDLIIMQFSDTFYGDGSSGFAIVQVVGTPSGSPADPTPSGSTDYVPLARVRVNANATTITSGNITDLRAGGHAKSLSTLFTVGLGGITPIQSSTERATLGAHQGELIYRTDTNLFEYWDGAAWRQLRADVKPYAQMTQTVAQSLTNSAETTVNWDTTIDDTDSMADLVNDRFNVQTSGVYHVLANVLFAANGTGERYTSLYYAGNQIAVSSHPTALAGFVASASCEAYVRATAGNNIQAKCFQSSGGSLNTFVTFASQFSVEWVTR